MGRDIPVLGKLKSKGQNAWLVPCLTVGGDYANVIVTEQWLRSAVRWLSRDNVQKNTQKRTQLTAPAPSSGS